MESSRIITKIEKQKQNPKRYNIYLDDQYSFSVHEEVLISKRLLKGKEVDTKEITRILKEEEHNKIWQRALKYLSFRPRTIKEVNDHLVTFDFDPEIIQNVIKKLIEQKWLDDSRYAHEFTRQRLKLKPRGKKLIALEMKNRGIHSVFIEESLNIIDNDTEYQMALELALKKFHINRNKDWVTIQRKIGGFLLRKGFSYDIVNQVFQQLKVYKNECNEE